MLAHGHRMVDSSRVYVEHCRVYVDDGRVVFADASDGAVSGIPYKNTPFLLLGNGTSITNDAVRLLAQQRVPIGFCGSQSTPLFSVEDIVWSNAVDEYGPSEYMQQWARIFFDEKKRLGAAKTFFKRRLDMIERVWSEEGYQLNPDKVLKKQDSLKKLAACTNVNDVLVIEASMTKSIYAAFARKLGPETQFTRERGIEKPQNIADRANKRLDRGNYMAYGFAAGALAAVGIPHGFPVMHGKTRRGGLVFDVADLVKDAIVLPESFNPKSLNQSNFESKKIICQLMTKFDAIEYMIDTIKICIASQDEFA